MSQERRKRRTRSGRARNPLRVVSSPDYQPNWYADSFNEDYARIYSSTDDTASKEVRSLLSYLGLPAKSKRPSPRLLDVGCGWARHSLLLAQRGYSVTGIDLSQTMLDKAMEYAGATGIDTEFRDAVGNCPAVRVNQREQSEADLTLIRCDMRDMSFGPEFDVAINMFTSFGYFQDDETNGRIVRQIYSALRPGGKFLIDVDNPHQYVARRVGDYYFTVVDDDGEGLEVRREERFDWARDRRVVQYSFVDQSADPIYLECALYDREFLGELLEDCGFEVQQQVWGGWEKLRYDKRTSPRLIMVGVKADN